MSTDHSIETEEDDNHKKLKCFCTVFTFKRGQELTTCLYIVIALLVSTIQGLVIYCVQFPIGLESIMIKVMNIDFSEYNVMFSAYTWCDIVMSIVGSVLVNKYFGIRFGLILFTAIFMLGQVFVSIGAYYNTFLVVLIGRIVLGLGRGTAASAGYSYKVKEYTGKNLSFLLSIGRCFTRIMSTLALFTPTTMYDSLQSIPSPVHRHGTVQMVATFACFCCFALSIIIAVLDTLRVNGQNQTVEPDDHSNISDIRNFPISFWIVVVFCALYHAVTFPATVNAPLFFIRKYRYSLLDANLANSISYTGTIVITPLIALSIDYFGYNLIFALLGVIFALISNILYMISDGECYLVPIIAAVINSLAFAFFGSAALWVMIGYLAPANQMTTACGIQMACFAIFTSLTSFVSGIILDNYGFLLLYVFYFILLLITINLIAFLIVFELLEPENRILNVTGKTRRGSEKFFPF